MVEFVAKNNELASTKTSPFFATKGMSFDIVDFSNAGTHNWIFKLKALDISGNMETTWKFAQKTIVVT